MLADRRRAAAEEDDALRRVQEQSWFGATSRGVLAHQRDWGLARGLLLSYGLGVEPVLLADAERAAAMWRRGAGLSLGGRLCMATAERLGAVVWTADAGWGSTDAIRQVR